MLTYIKGQGWVPEPEYTITMKCGTVVKLEFRAPLSGEMYDGIDWGHPEYEIDKKPNKEKWAKDFKYMYYNKLVRSTRRPRDANYCVAIPVAFPD